MPTLRVVFFGEDSFSAAVVRAIIDAGYEVALIATPFYENKLYKRLESTAQEFDIPFVRQEDIHSKEFVNLVGVFKPDLIVTAHFEKLLRRELISIPTLGCINLHPSLLPLYRGMSPQHWPIINGDRETGVTIHFIEEGIDTGNIVVQKRVPVAEHVYVADLQRQMLPVYKEAILEALTLLEAGYQGVDQDIASGSFYGRFKRVHAELNPMDSATRAYNLIRAASKPYIGARFGNVCIWKAEPLDAAEENIFFKQLNSIGFHTFGVENSYLVLNDGILRVSKFEYI